ncbi:MAG: DUF4388 domain-containing protein [Candidatus Aminicenantes bacterium]|nr:DUF4388 domain-containing protein [Candidatus Aminicenantes bacterium]
MNRPLPISGPLSEIDVATILALMQAQALEGRLKVTASPSTKTLWLQDGRVVFAQSSLAADSLGSFLLRRRVIDRSALEKGRRRMKKSGSRLGRALLEMGLLSPEILWAEVDAHLRAIVFSLFPLRSGRYDIAPLPDGARENIRLELTVPQAIVEGVRLIRDEEFIESRFEAGMTLYPGSARGCERIALKPHEDHVLSLVAGPTPVEDVVRRSELLRLDTLRILYFLLKLDRLADRRVPARRPTPQAVVSAPAAFASFEETLQYYNARFEYIYRVLSKEIGPVAHSILSDAITAVQESLPSCFRDLELRPDGRLDDKSVMKGVWYENFAENSKPFLAGLEEILYAEIYAVKRHLGKEHERSILQWIREPGS